MWALLRPVQNSTRGGPSLDRNYYVIRGGWGADISITFNRKTLNAFEAEIRGGQTDICYVYCLYRRHNTQ